MAAKPVLIQAKFDYEKETKGAHRYAEQGEQDAQVIRSLYIRKTAFNGEVPQNIELTIK